MSFNAKSILYKCTVLFQTIQFSIRAYFNCQKHFYFKLFSLVKQFYFKQFSFVFSFCPHTQLNVKTVLFQIIQFCISTRCSSILPIDWTLSSTTTPGQSEPGRDSNEEVLCIPQSSSITGNSPSDFFVSYPGHSLGRSYPSAEMQYSTAPANWAIVWVSYLFC